LVPVLAPVLAADLDRLDVTAHVRPPLNETNRPCNPVVPMIADTYPPGPGLPRPSLCSRHPAPSRDRPRRATETGAITDFRYSGTRLILHECPSHVVLAAWLPQPCRSAAARGGPRRRGARDGGRGRGTGDGVRRCPGRAGPGGPSPARRRPT